MNRCPRGQKLGKEIAGCEFPMLGRAANPSSHASRFFRLTPIGEEQIGFAGCTTSAVIDVFRGKTCRLKLPAIGLRQIEHLLSLHRFPFRKEGCKTVGYVFSHFVTAGANARSDSGVDIGRSDAKRVYQAVHCAFRYSGGSSPPTSMNGGDGMMNGIDQQNRHAIGGADADTAMGFIGDERVSFVAAITEPMSVQNRGGVYLP